MIDAVLFDLDGTLVSYQDSYRDLLLRVAKGWDIFDENSPFLEVYSRAILAEGSVTLKSAIGEAFMASGSVMPSNADEKCREMLEDYVRGIELLPWTINLLDRYAGFPKAIVSNGPFDMQLSAIKKFNLDRLVDRVVISGDPEVGIRKPNPAIFRWACNRLGVAPARALMIGDNDSVDVLGARAAGLQAVNIADLVAQG